MSVKDTVLEDFLLIDRGEVLWVPTKRSFAAYTNKAKILVCLHSANGSFVSRYDIAECVWPWSHPPTRELQVSIHIGELRRDEGITIITRHGYGYCLRVDERY